MSNTKIKPKNGPSQHAGTGLNLGGPTSIYLAEPEKAVNRNWAMRYDALNGGE